MDSKLCLICRRRMFCGKNCKAFEQDLRISLPAEIFGSSPPSIFVSRRNYPNVFACPAVPPFTGDTAIYDRPELWKNLSIDEILNFRFSLILGQFRVDARNPYSKNVELIQELSLYEEPVDVEIKLEKPPKPRIVFDDNHAPFGPFAPAKGARICSSSKVRRIVEKIYESRDVSAVNAIKILYEKGIAVSQIQKLLSAGALGMRRRLVPTRWAITAVDNAVSEHLIEELKSFELMDEYQVFVHKKAKNLFMAILIPRVWSFEWGEAWFPETTWNFSSQIVVECNSEGFKGREEYASLGGCYYAARLATAEYLHRIKKQCSAVLWREIYSGFKLPIGVWFVRETVREMFTQKPTVFEKLSKTLDFLSTRSKLIEDWKKNSKLLKELREQKTLCQF